MEELLSEIGHICTISKIQRDNRTILNNLLSLVMVIYGIFWQFW